MIENRRNFTITTIHITRPIAAAQLLTHENKDSSTAHQFSCCIHRLKRSRTSPHSPGPQPGTLTTASGVDDEVDVSHRQELSTGSSYCYCCEPKFDPAQLEGRHDPLDSPRTLCIRVPSLLAWGRNSVRELRAQKWLVLGDGGRGSILTGSHFFWYSTIGILAVDYTGSSTNCCCIIPVPGTWFV